MLAFRSILAVALIAGFFLLALGLAALLIWIPIYGWLAAGVLYGKGTALCFFGALVILGTIWPQRDVFLPPGPRLDEDKHPRLFEKIRACATATNSPMPRAVYLVPEPNAWVSRRGGFLFSGGEPILGLGLPLLSVLTTSQLTAVLAHEFGHELGGDTRLGGWIYRTRLSLLRATGEFGSLEGHVLSLLKFPFLLYGRLFIGITTAVSRRQELRADELSGRIAGVPAAVSALETIHVAGPAYQRFLEKDFGPLLARGYRAPLMQGFRRFFSRLSEKDQAELLKKTEAPAGRTAEDTHPPLEERIRNLHALGGEPKPAETAPACDLVAWDASLEKDIVAQMTNQTDARRSTALSWEELDTDEVCRRVFLADRKEYYRAYAKGLRGIRPDQLPDLAKSPEALGRRLTPQKLFSHHYASLASGAVGTALILALHSRGCALRKQPGRSLCVAKGDHVLEADAILADLHEARLSPEAWAQQCNAYGISEIDLGLLEPAAPSDGAP